MKKTIRLTENGLSRIVAESVNRILNEGGQRMFTGTDNDSIEKKWQ